MRNIWIKKSEFPIGSIVKFGPSSTPLYKVIDHEIIVTNNKRVGLLVGIEKIDKDAPGMARFSAFPQSLEKV